MGVVGFGPMRYSRDAHRGAPVCALHVHLRPGLWAEMRCWDHSWHGGGAETLPSRPWLEPGAVPSVVNAGIWFLDILVYCFGRLLFLSFFLTKDKYAV